MGERNHLTWFKVRFTEVLLIQSEGITDSCPSSYPLTVSINTTTIAVAAITISTLYVSTTITTTTTTNSDNFLQKH